MAACCSVVLPAPACPRLLLPASLQAAWSIASVCRFGGPFAYVRWCGPAAPSTHTSAKRTPFEPPILPISAASPFTASAALLLNTPLCLSEYAPRSRTARIAHDAAAHDGLHMRKAVPELILLGGRSACMATMRGLPAALTSLGLPASEHLIFLHMLARPGWGG